MQVDPKSWPVLSALMDEWLDLPEERRAAWLASLDPKYANLLPTLRELLSQPKRAFLDTSLKSATMLEIQTLHREHSALACSPGRIAWSASWAAVAWEWSGSPRARTVR